MYLRNSAPSVSDADHYSMEIELPLADCPLNLGIYAMVINIIRNLADNLTMELKELRIL